MVELLSKSSDTVGILGVILLLSAYYLLNINKLSALSFYYPILNFIGSILILYSLMFKWNFPSVCIEIVWALISIIGIYRALSRKKKQQEKLNNLYPIDSLKK